MNKRQEVGSLVHHEGQVTCADFFSTTHLITGGEEGSIAIWRRKNNEWDLVKPMKGHKYATLPYNPP
jgi:protein MAK11